MSSTILETVRTKNIKHIAIKVNNEETRKKLVDFILENMGKLCNTLDLPQLNDETLLLVDLSNKGENGRPLDESGNGTLKMNAVKQSLLTIANAVGVGDTQQAFTRFVFLTCNICGIFITNGELPQRKDFNDNPVYQSACPIMFVEVDDDLNVVEETIISEYENKEDLLKEDESRITLR